MTIEQRSIHSPSYFPKLYKCNGCHRLISDVSSRGMKKQLCEKCGSGETERKALSFAKNTYKNWDKTTPPYKFDVLHHTAIKFEILNNRPLNQKQLKNNRNTTVKNYVNKNRKRIYTYNRSYYKIIIGCYFKKFWDRIEGRNIL